MPDFLPFHWELILISGVLEIGFGIGVLFDRFRNISLIGIVLILILFMSVHVNMLVPENTLGYNTHFLLLERYFNLFLFIGLGLIEA